MPALNPFAVSALLAGAGLGVQALPHAVHMDSFPNTFQIAAVGVGAPPQPQPQQQEQQQPAVQARDIQSINAGSTLIVPIVGDSGPSPNGGSSSGTKGENRMFKRNPEPEPLGYGTAELVDSQIIGGINTSGQLIDGQFIHQAEAPCVCPPHVEVCPPCRPPKITYPKVEAPPPPVQRTQTCYACAETKVVQVPGPTIIQQAPPEQVVVYAPAPTLIDTVTEIIAGPTFTQIERPVVHQEIIKTVNVPGPTEVVYQPGPTQIVQAPQEHIVVTAPAPVQTITDIVYEQPTVIVEAPAPPCPDFKCPPPAPPAPAPIPAPAPAPPAMQIIDGQIILPDGTVQWFRQGVPVPGPLKLRKRQDSSSSSTSTSSSTTSGSGTDVSSSNVSSDAGANIPVEEDVTPPTEGPLANEETPLSTEVVPLSEEIPEGPRTGPVTIVAPLRDTLTTSAAPAATGMATELAEGQVESSVASELADGQVESGMATELADGQIEAGANVATNAPVVQQGMILHGDSLNGGHSVWPGRVISTEVVGQTVGEPIIQQVGEFQPLVEHHESYVHDDDCYDNDYSDVLISKPVVAAVSTSSRPCKPKTVHSEVVYGEPSISVSTHELPLEYGSIHEVPAFEHSAHVLPSFEHLEIPSVEHISIESPVEEYSYAGPSYDDDVEIISRPRYHGKSHKKHSHRRPTEKYHSFAVRPAKASTHKTSGSFTSSYSNANGVQVSALSISKRALDAVTGLVRRQNPYDLPAGVLSLTLDNGILRDALGRTGYIASNYQFQFDEPPQAGYLIAEGFGYDSATGHLTLRGSDTFWSCSAGSFSNLYDRNWAPQCVPVNIVVVDSGSQAHAYTPRLSIPPTHAELVWAGRQGFDPSQFEGATAETIASAQAELNGQGSFVGASTFASASA